MILPALLLAALPAFSEGPLTVREGDFLADGKPYRFVGANLWYGMNLDDGRLGRELDRLKALGVTNLRVMGASEGPDTEPWRMVPALQPKPGVYDPEVLAGLDRLLAAAAERRMKVVVVLNNFWPWSGGMAQYLAWSGRGPIPYPPPAAGGTWDGYQRFAGGFYSDKKALAMFRGFVRFIVPRLKGSPALMAWELANEPRADRNGAAMRAWMRETARLIKKLDPPHLVTTGSEGLEGFKEIHSIPEIDYATMHVWAQNWGWFDPASTSTFAAAEARMRDFVAVRAAQSAELGKPVVLEEFGLARDSGVYEPAARTTLRDRYYADVFEAVRDSTHPVAGADFWAWSGEGRPPRPGGPWKAGDPWVGDPPHEMQGWYGVYDSDAGTAAAISDAAARLR